MILRMSTIAAAADIVSFAAPAAADRHDDTFACTPLADAIAEERLPVRWIEAAPALAELVELGEPPVCAAALDVISPAGVSELGRGEGACLTAMREVDDMATEDGAAAGAALTRMALAAGRGEDCAAALGG